MEMQLTQRLWILHSELTVTVAALVEAEYRVSIVLTAALTSSLLPVIQHLQYSHRKLTPQATVFVQFIISVTAEEKIKSPLFKITTSARQEHSESINSAQTIALSPCVSGD